MSVKDMLFFGAIIGAAWWLDRRSEKRAADTQIATYGFQGSGSLPGTTFI